jgi:hypothetical protein
VGIGIFIYQQWRGNDNSLNMIVITPQQTDSIVNKSEDSTSPDSLAIKELLIKKAALEELYNAEIDGTLSGIRGIGEIAKNLKKQIDEIQIKINKIRFPNSYVQESQNEAITSKQEVVIYDDEILKTVEQAENYLLNNDKKSIDILKYYESTISKLYAKKGLSEESNKLLNSTLKNIRMELKKHKAPDYLDNTINEIPDTLPNRQDDMCELSNNPFRHKLLLFQVIWKQSESNPKIIFCFRVNSYDIPF